MKPSPPPSPQFLAKKQGILSALALDARDYEDKSPKGSVDIQILDLIQLINNAQGWVTTSSCAGRVAVFVEGPKKTFPRTEASPIANTDDTPDGHAQSTVIGSDQTPLGATQALKTAPGGKGGGHWLFVSHEPLPQASASINEEHWASFFKLSRSSVNLDRATHHSLHRLIRLTFSPLILHVLCASLQHARPLLSAAINAGFRESGVQSLKALDSEQVGEGVMVAIRTNGIVFESMVGVWDESSDQGVAMVSEEYLAMCANVVNERFEFNVERKRRLMEELQSTLERESSKHEEQPETREERRKRKETEGLKRQQNSKDAAGQTRNRVSDIDLAGFDIG
ncbi:uncharacterized protein HMPREF1541_04400 [Cyphellophora europaea CBS 101466]|uniref:tRNA(Phe) 7-[(3-amino-3-carboxypropyl)-4-demethylwyosine(37)-N(4)]-methyltransferase n=1 Tax=Cyphellophora europaea (strain CBS 101466) TaxID=1220924 RepID=W2RUZ2_CYPE1|nr:uncharacterized protein HMPREF1541_04400 [Cyphellophora europaea CBS 101466]ETN40125.1 hypothetical protein HMPREF1541_04400 [Cyphellophora europaea CBS 101466]